MTEAKAEPEYGMNSYKEYKDNSNVEKIECSNINIHNNGINTRDADVLSRTPDGNGLETTANTDNGQQLSTHVFGNNERNNGFKQNDEDVVVKCIQNNNNGRGGGDGKGESPCEECFTKFLTEEQLAVVELALEPGIDITIGGESITIDSLLELCTELEVATPDELMATLNAVFRSIVLEAFGDIDVFPL